MSYPSVPIRHIRRLYSTTSSAISISQAKSKLRNEHDPDKALEIYSSVSKHYRSPVSSRYAQDLTVRRLAKSHRFSDIEKLIESQKNDPKIIQEPFLSTLIRSYGRAGMFDQALRTYDQMDQLGTPRSAISFNALLSACINSKLFDKVPVLFDEIPKKHGVVPDKISYGILVKSFCEVGSPEKALETVKEVEKEGVEITTIAYTTILEAFYKKGKREEAETLWSLMHNKDCIDVIAYNVRIMAEQGGKPEIIRALIEEMSNAGLKPDTNSYNCLMTCYLKSGMVDEAQKVYEGLEEYGCKPNAATFRTLVFYLSRNGDFEKGYQIFEESVKMNRIPDFNTMKHLVEGLVNINKMTEAKELIRTIKKKFPPNMLNAWRKIEENLNLNDIDAVPNEDRVAAL
ncbi:Pentatricopeptide repeat-containing protein [Quillaja saponaria]|uniref:Pentatricopeptide repeat-containing protein n=1 Tax=Quillaja saponaria TaxID=32244 RepID=A0AAD7KRI4_QUISA|nr:Pentatricopeptide repeat-containing protein [Quillaja saponaria]